MKPLDGVLVLDLSRVLAGPYCTMVLGDLGARILKVESPEGDDTRRWGPPFAGGESAYFLSVNRNKESLTLDFKHPQGAEILERLIEQADVLVENFRPGTLERLGFGYEACRARNPRLIYASLSAYGRTGPEAQRPGYDLVIQGEGGVMHLTGSADGPPTKVGVSEADLAAGLWLLSGILGALLVREKTGEGQFVDVALLDGQVSLLAFQAQSYFLTGRGPERMGNRHPTLTPYETYATADGWINVAVGTETQWRALCAAIERPELAVDSRFVTNADRVAHREVLEAALVPLLRLRSTSAWLAVLARAQVPAGAVRTVVEVLESAEVQRRQMVVELEHPTVGPLRMTGLPVKFSATPGGPHRPPPLLGEHSEAVLCDLLGLSSEEVAALREEGAI